MVKKSKKKTAASPEKNNWESVLSLETNDEKLFPQLKKEETSRVEAMFKACENIDEITIEQENTARTNLKIKEQGKEEGKISMPWTCNSINTLNSGEWLNDEIINGFIFDNVNNTDKDNHFFNTYLFSKVLEFFITEALKKKHNDVLKHEKEMNTFKQKLTEKKSNDLIEKKLNNDENNFDTRFIRYTKNVANIQDKRKLFFPLNVDGNHWILAVVFVQEGIIGYFDSFNSKKTMTRYNPFLLRYLKIIFKDKDWITTLIESPKQSNSCDCGVFLCANLYYLSQNRMPNFTKKDIPNIRNFMAHFYFKKPLLPSKKPSPKKTSPKNKVIDVIDLMYSPPSSPKTNNKKSKKKSKYDGNNDDSEQITFRNLFNNDNDLVYFRKIKLNNGTEFMNEHMRLDKNSNRITTLFSNERFIFSEITEYHITGQIHRIYNSTTSTWFSPTV